MSGGDLPPRQKMIGMMYLVLLALLALNVSKSILEAFVSINTGIVTTTKTFAMSNDVIYRAFDKAALQSPAAKVWSKKAHKVKKMAEDMYQHIHNIKTALIVDVDKVPKAVADTTVLEDVEGKDNYESTTRLMGVAEPGVPIKLAGYEEISALTLKEKLAAYHKGLLAVFDSKDVREEVAMKITYLNTPDVMNNGVKENWEAASFYHSPLAAAMTLLSKIQSDVRTAEAEVINKLYERIDAGGISFNNVEGMAVLPKAYIMEGDSFRASIFTAAYDDRTDPEIFIGDYDSVALVNVAKTLKFDPNKIMKGTKGTKWGDGDWYEMNPKDVSDGKGHLIIKESLGVHDWGGVILLKTKKGPKAYPFKSSFEVGKPATTVSAEKMNVFYIGVDNPVSVSAPMPDFKASAPGLRQGRGQGQYIMRPKRKGKVTIVVTGIDGNGKSIRLGKKEFRVKRIPDPKSYLGGKSGSESIKKAAFKAASTVQARMDNFDFDIRVKVKSFSFSTTKSGLIQEVRVPGNKLNGKCKAMIKSSKRNQRFYIEKIKVVMPDGTTRKLAPIILKVI